MKGKLKDRIKNQTFREQLCINSIETTIQQLGWLGHLLRMGDEKIAKKIFELRELEKRKGERPRKT